MIIEKEVIETFCISAEVKLIDIIDSISNEEDALNIILRIDKVVESWPFTLNVITELLKIVNTYSEEIREDCECEDLLQQMRIAAKKLKAKVE